MFDPNIPVYTSEILTNEILAKLKTDYAQYDEAYVFNACIDERRLVLDQAYYICKDYLDDDFANEICIPGKFISRIWELALCSIFLHKGYTLEKRIRTNKKARPDFCILIDEKKIWVEAVCPSLGEVDPVPPPPILVPGVIHSETLDIAADIRPRALSASSAFIGKVAKREKYLKGGLMKENEPLIIAVNTYQITRHSDTMVDELLLYGMGLHQMTQDGVWSRQYIPEIKKMTEKGEVLVPMAYFLREEYKSISGAIFFSKWFEFEIDWRDTMADSAITYFNSGTSLPVEKKHITFGRRRYAEATSGYIELKDFTAH